MRIVIYLLFGAAFLSGWGCGGPGSGADLEETISAEAFVEAYFQLRSTGLRSPLGEIPTEVRDSVLEDLGLTEEDILTFVEVWGDDGEVMQRVWEEVDSLLRNDRMRGRGNREESDGGEEDVGFGEVG